MAYALTMRKDLNKLLCERERIAGSKSYRHIRRSKQAKDLEDAPRQEGMRRPYDKGYRRKEFNENLTPLKGIVRKAVGRRWDSFYSELCRTFDMTTEINKHILQHLEQYIERGVYLSNGKLMVKAYGGRYGLGANYPLFGSQVEIFVDPRDGIIRKNKYHATYRQQAIARTARLSGNPNYMIVDDDTVLRREKEIWFIYKMGDIPGGGTYHTREDGRVVFHPNQVHDVFINGPVYRTPHQTRYHVSRRSAGKKLLRSLGL